MSDEQIKPFKGQVYNELKSMYNSRRLFEDPYFSATNKSLYNKTMPLTGVRWMRPKEARKNPQFVVEGFGRCDMDQGYLGNCWFIAASVGIMQNQKLFAKVVPNDQSLTDNYAGIFHFRFWLYGEWVDVVVDDRLPYWPDGNLVFCSNKSQPDEFWGPLLEKAYAKMYGSYENLDAGQTYDALIDMSGGIQEQFEIKKLEYSEKANFWKIIEDGFKKGTIFGCSINADPRIKEARMRNGLVRGHAYTITSIIDDITSNGRENKLIRIRNPWGNDVEWNGAWSDNSSEWNSLTEQDKQEIGLVKEKDGEFWMNYSDFMANWDTVQACHITADSYSAEVLETDNDQDLSWKCTMYNSSWVVGSSAGGCGQYNQAKFWTNPQFLVTLTDVDKDDNENKATLIVSLMQKDTRIKRLTSSEDVCEEYVQFKLFKVRDDVVVDETKTTGLRLYSSQLDRIGSSGSYINSREVTKRFRVDPGHYLIIPSTYDEDHACDFLLRIFTEQAVQASALEEHKDELNDDDSYFDFSNDDNIFNDWINFLSPKVFKGKTSLFNLDDESNGEGSGEAEQNGASSGFAFSLIADGAVNNDEGQENNSEGASFFQCKFDELNEL